MRRLLVPVLVVLALTQCQNREEPVSATDTTATSTQPGGSALGIQYVGIDPSVFQPTATIDGWIGATPINTTAIADHVWAIWGGMTAPTNQTVNGAPIPVWETWYDTDEVYGAMKGSGPQTTASGTNVAAAEVAHETSHPKRRFHFPHQFFRQENGLGLKAIEAAGSAPGILLSFNRFTQEMKDHVAANQYYDSTVLTNLNAGWPASTPLAQRAIQNFPNTSIMLKPVFWVVSGSQPTAVPYWNGTGTDATSNPANPTPNTWKQCVLVDPTGNATNNQPINCNGTTIQAGTYQVVPVSQFYSVTLTQAEIADLNLMNQGDALGASNVSVSQLQPGDLALFVASHVSTREIDNWTWQTFWWSPTPQQVPAQPPAVLTPPAQINAPWNNYVACQAYYMVTPPNDQNGTPHLCYNPYLETGLTNLDNATKTQTATGTSSNCMTCHRAAAWPGAKAGYAQAFFLDPGNPTWFDGTTKTDFTWAMVNFAHTAPFIPQPSVGTAVNTPPTSGTTGTSDTTGTSETTSTSGTSGRS